MKYSTPSKILANRQSCGKLLIESQTNNDRIMNSILALLTSNPMCCGVTVIVLIIAIIFVGGRFYESKHEAFIEEIKKEFPGCKVTHDDDVGEARIIYEGQPLIVKMEPDGTIQSEPYEPDANQALTS